MISALLFYLIPYLLGRSIIRIIHKRHRLFCPAASYFVAGSLFIFLIALIERYFLLSVVPGMSFLELFKPTLTILLALAAVINILLFWKAPDLNISKHFWPLLLCILLSGITFIIWVQHSPYPLNWDFLEHQTLVNNILAGRFSYFTSQITDTFIFDGYSSLFHTLLASSQMFISADIIGFWQSISFLHLIMVVFASYILAFTISDNKGIAALSAIISASIFETVAFTAVFFIPQTFVAVIFIILFSQLLMEIKHDRVLPFWLVLISLIFLILSHYIVGFVAAVIYFGMYMFIRYGEWLKSKVDFTALIEISILGSIFLILFSSLISSGFLNQGEGQYFNFTLTDKLSFIQEAYGYSLYILLPLGTFYTLKRKKLPEIIMLIICLMLVVIIFLQVSYVLKFLVLGRYFINFIMALGLYFLISKVSNRFLNRMTYIYIAAVFIGIFIINSIYWKGNLYYHNLQTQIAPNELVAANFLQKNYQNTNILMISDPATQNILETFSKINSQGGAYMILNTRQKLIEVAESSSTAEIKDKIFQIKDSIASDSGKRLWILSGRYFNWQKASKDNREALYFNVWAPSDLDFNSQKYIQFLLSDSQHFKLVYQNNTLAIVEVLP